MSTPSIVEMFYKRQLKRSQASNRKGVTLSVKGEKGATVTVPICPDGDTSREKLLEVGKTLPVKSNSQLDGADGVTRKVPMSHMPGDEATGIIGDIFVLAAIAQGKATAFDDVDAGKAAPVGDVTVTPTEPAAPTPTVEPAAPTPTVKKSRTPSA